MLDVVLAIGIPVLAGLILTLLRAVASQQALSRESSQDVALDMTFLAIGAAGSVFHDPKVHKTLGEYTMVVMLVMIMADLLVGAALLYLRRFAVPRRNSEVAWNMTLGLLPLLAVSAVIYMGARVG